MTLIKRSKLLIGRNDSKMRLTINRMKSSNRKTTEEIGKGVTTQELPVKELQRIVEVQIKVNYTTSILQAEMAIAVL